ncbi:MAG: hypothetical protein P8P74_14150 [Crocinitomicaceae bacterium]|nr:hypothetical protein [Crocinitomicaceae bacterium]
MSKRFRYYLFLTLITPICFEIALRILGYGPYRQTEYSISSKPSMCLKASDQLGFSLGEGTFQVSVNGAPKYTATHVDGRRITRKYRQKIQWTNIFIMGCSFTYGMGVEDSVSFPYQLQDTLGGFADIQNFGVPGFGNVQSYLQLKREVKNGNKPGLVVVNFCDFHHERNSLTPTFRNSLVLGYQRSNKEVSKELAKSKFPFMKNGKLTTVAFDDMYSNWLGRETFAAVHYFQSIQDKRSSEKINLEENSLALFSQMKSFCDKHEIKLIVTGLTKNRATRSFLSSLEKSGIQSVDISLDLKQKKHNQLPYDSHPNEKAHAHFAQALFPIISEWVISSLSPAN